MTGLAERGTNDVVFALCHEVGNLVGAIRLHAHRLDEDASSIQLAQASVEIDDSSARIRSLLALVRPLLAGPEPDDDGVGAGALVRGVGETLDETGGRGVAVEIDGPEGLPRVRGRLETLHHLLATFAYHALEQARPRGRVRIQARADGGAGTVVFRVEDDGREEEDLGRVSAAAPTGRALACEIAEIVVGGFGGAVAAGRAGDVTRIELTLPVC